MGGDAVEHCRLGRAESQVGAPDQAAARLAFEHLTRLACDLAVGAGQCRPEGVEDVPLGLYHQRRWQVFKAGVDAELRQSLQAFGHGR